MFNFLKKNFIYIVFTILMVIIIVSLFIFRDSKPTRSFGSNSNNSNTNSIGGKEVLNFQEQQTINYDQKISDLIPQMPYSGQNFILRYDLSTNTFTLILSSENPEAGTEEFNNYLKQNGILNSNSIRYLNIQTQ